MNTKIRLSRKPLTTALWTLLVAAMALLLSVGAAMMYSSGSLAGILDQYHTSIAVRTDRATYAFEEEEGVRWQFEDKSLAQTDIDQLLALYALLYQGSQRKNLGIMRSLGASPKLAAKYLFGSGMTVAGVGIAVGTLLAGSVLRAVQAELFRQSFGMEISKYSNAVLSDNAIHEMVARSQLPLWVILAIGAVQLAVFALILKYQAERTSRCAPRDLLSK